MPNFKTDYNEKHKAAIQKDLGLANVMEIPKLEKITINMGLGEALQNSKLIESGVEQLKIIAGQMPVITKAKKSISNFKLREGVPIGVKVTMRGNRMYEFWERLVCFALPRVRDFTPKKVRYGKKIISCEAKKSAEVYSARIQSM
jgi:large subunit ribosomal protein L5